MENAFWDWATISVYFIIVTKQLKKVILKRQKKSVIFVSQKGYV